MFSLMYILCMNCSILDDYGWNNFFLILQSSKSFVFLHIYLHVFHPCSMFSMLFTLLTSSSPLSSFLFKFGQHLRSCSVPNCYFTWSTEFQSINQSEWPKKSRPANHKPWAWPHVQWLLIIRCFFFFILERDVLKMF